MTVKNKVEMRIGGKEYTLVGVESEEYIQKVGLYIDRKMNEIIRHNNKLSTSMAAVLTAVNVADDFFKSYESEAQLKKENKQMQEELEKLKQENRHFTGENSLLLNKNTNLQLELAKREAELNEVRNNIEKSSRDGFKPNVRASGLR